MLEPLLQYQSLKAVLQHTDANTRFRISLHIPSIRSLEKRIPLKINHLKLRDDIMKVNDTSYRIRNFQHFPDGDAPRVVKESNGETRFDFDEFGFHEYADNVVLPGDISFQEENRIEHPNEYPNEEAEAWLRSYMRCYEKVLEIHADLESKGITMDDYLKGLAPLAGNLGEEYKTREILKLSSEEVARRLENTKYRLLPFDCRRDNTKFPITCYIQLTIKRGESKQIQRFEYNKKLYEAVKHLNEVLFGTRPMPIRVETLDVISLDEICRLPAGFQLQVRNVHASHRQISHRNFNLLLENSGNLNSLLLHHNVSRNVVQNQVVRNAKTIEIVITERYFVSSSIFTDLPNLEISILSRESELSSAHYLRMIQCWLWRERPVGASIRIKTREEHEAREILELVRSMIGERCVTIHKNDSINVEVSCVPFEGPKFLYDKNINWILKLQIVNV